MLKKPGFLASLLVCFSLTGFSQARFEEVISRQNRPLYFDELNWSGKGQDLSCLFEFKISLDYLSFINQSPVGNPPVYHGEIGLTVEVTFQDSSIQRFYKVFSKNSDDLASTKKRFEFLTGGIQFRSASNPVRYVVDITDLGNKKTLFKTPRTVRIKAKSVPGFLTSWFGQTEDGRMKTANLGKNIPYGTNNHLFLGFTDTAGTSGLKTKLLQRLFDEDQYGAAPDSLQPELQAPEVLTVSGPDSSITVSGRKVRFPLNNLDAGQYALTVQSGNSSDTVYFMIYWLNMPYSLYDLDVATRTMKYIASDDDYDGLTSGSSAKRIQAFRTFWKKRDPSAGTAYNELMAEYFRRVDFTFVNFPTSRDPGWRTDRGRIYLLYGEPGTKNRVTPPNQPPQETWTYPRIKKTFVFSDLDGKGDFKLISGK